MLDYIRKIFRRRDVVLEMTYNYEDYINKALSHYKNNIVEIYAMIYYAVHCTDIPYYKYHINQWKQELLVLIDKVQGMKAERNNRKIIYKAFKYAWEKKAELNKDNDIVIRFFMRRFKSENINSTEDENIAISRSFISNIDKLIYELAYGDTISAESFINSI